MGQGPSGPRATFVISRGRLFWPEQNGQQAFRQLLFPGNLLASAGRSLSAPSGLLTWFSVPLRTERKSRRYRERSGVVKGRQRAWPPVCVSLALRAQGLAAAVCDAAGGRESVENVSLVTLARIWPTVRGWRARRKGFVSPDNVGKRRPSRPDRFQGFRLSLPGNGREGLRDSGRGGGRVRECARVCPEMLRLPQPPGRGHPTFSGCLPKAIDSSEKKSITTLRAPALDCTCPELTSFISRKQFYLIASWSF